MLGEQAKREAGDDEVLTKTSWEGRGDAGGGGGGSGVFWPGGIHVA